MMSFQKPSMRFYAGIVSIIAGFVCLRTPPIDGVWTLTIAPILLVLGYVVLVPTGLWPQCRHGLTGTRDSPMSRVLAVDRIVGLGVFAACLAVYLRTLWPAPGWWDSSNYVAGRCRNGEG